MKLAVAVFLAFLGMFAFVSAIPHGPCRSKYDGNYAISDCTKYLTCSGGVHRIMNCPYGLQFYESHYGGKCGYGPCAHKRHYTPYY